MKRENARVLALEQISSNEHKVDLESHQGFLFKKIVFDGGALFEIFSMTNFSCKKCETEIGSVERQKEEELGTLTRLLEGLKLDKDILTQLKVRKYVSQCNKHSSLHFFSSQVNLQAKVARKLAGKKS